MRSTLASGTPVELARPADGRAADRGLVLIPDIFGLRPLFDEHAQRIADEQGWAVAAVEPWPGREDLTIEERLAQVGTIDDSAILGDLAAAADLLEVEPVGVMGFCMGGMFTLKAAGTGRFHRAVRVLRDDPRARALAGGRSVEPLDAVVAAPGACPTLAIIGWSTSGRRPTTSPRSRRPAWRWSATPAPTTASSTTPSRPAHRPDDAADAWRRAMTFLSPS